MTRRAASSARRRCLEGDVARAHRRPATAASSLPTVGRARRPDFIRGLLCLALLLAGGCKATGKAGGAAAPDFGDDLAAIEQQLARHEADLRVRGVTVPASTPTLAGGVAQGPATDPGAAMEAEDAGGDSLDEARDAAPEAPPTSSPTDASASAERQDKRAERPSRRCRDLCELADAICSLEGHVCGLAQHHADDPRYQAVCARARQDCQVAASACNQCTP